MPLYVKKEHKPIEARLLKDNKQSQEEIMEWCAGKKGLDGSVIISTPDRNETRMVGTGNYIVKEYSDHFGWHFIVLDSDQFEKKYLKVSE